MTHLRKAILQGTRNDGVVVDIPASYEGHLEVAIHEPITPLKKFTC